MVSRIPRNNLSCVKEDSYCTDKTTLAPGSTEGLTYEPCFIVGQRMHRIVEGVVVGLDILIMVSYGMGQIH
jgi:hypothetical protein